MQLPGVTLCSTSSPPALNLTSVKPLRILNLRDPILLPDAGDRKKLRFPYKLRSRRFGIRRENVSIITAASRGGGNLLPELNDDVRKLLQALLWIAEGVYVIWLFLLPYAPGDPVWAISSETINSLIGLSLNFFFILPLSNSVGLHLIEAPALHPMSEGLFNFVIGWTFLFAPLLYTDRRRDSFRGSLDVLWGFQMFLTNRVVFLLSIFIIIWLTLNPYLMPFSQARVLANSALLLIGDRLSFFLFIFTTAFLIPYMAIRLNKADVENNPRKTSQLGSLMTNGAPVVGLIGGLACLLSVLWALYGRGVGNFGDLRERWEFLLSYLGSERLAYAFIWDICLYIIFQPWLIGDNLQNLGKDKIDVLNIVRFVPVIGLIAYCLCLNTDNEK